MNFPIRWYHVALEVDGWTVAQLEIIRGLLADTLSLELRGGTDYQLHQIPPAVLVLTVLSATRLVSLTFRAEILARDLNFFFIPGVRVSSPIFFKIT